MRSRIATRQGPAVPGVIDSIAAGLTIALAQPLLMSVPVLLDLYYWIGWRITPHAVTEPLRRQLLDDPSATQPTADFLARLGRSDMTTMVALFVPSLLGGIDRGQLYEVISRPTLSPEPWWVVGLILIGLVIIAAGLFALYNVLLADAAIGRARSVAAKARAVVAAWYRYLAMLALVSALFLLILGPPAILWGILQALGIGLGVILLPVMVLVGAAIAILLIFVPEAIVVAEVGALKAMYLSVNVVRRNLWPTLGLTAASMIITVGLGQVWERLAGSPPGLLMAVVASAFFACGLTMASMIFFSERLRLWQPAAAPRKPPRGVPH